MKVTHIFSASQSAYIFMKGQFEYLNDNAVDITIVIPDDGFYKQVQQQFPKCNVVKSTIVRNISPVSDLKTLFYFVKLLNKLKPDIVHLHTPKAGLLGGLSAKFLLHNKVVFHLHGLVAVKGGKPIKCTTYYMEKLTLAIADRVIAVSPSLMDYCISENLVDSKKIEVLNNGTINGIQLQKPISHQEIDSLKQELGIKSRFVIGFLGRFNEDKGIKTVIEVFSDIAEEKNATLCLVGPDELDISIDSLVPERLSKYVRIVDRVENPYLYLSMFDIQLFPSVREGFGLALAEASLVGTPSVAFNIFGVKDAVKNGSTGTLVRYGDVEAMTKAVTNYIDNPKLLQSHKRAGIEYVSKSFNHQNLCEAQLNFYRDFIND